MFIRRKDYTAILRHGLELSERLNTVQADLSSKLSALAERLASLQDKLDELCAEPEIGDEH